MRTSFIIASYNDGELLANTVASVYETFGHAHPEVIVSDDGSVDNGSDDCLARFPEVRLIRQSERSGPSPAKDRAARLAAGDAFVFLDAHCKAEAGAFAELVENVRRRPSTVFVPEVPALDVENWNNKLHQSGCGAKLDLVSLRTPWAKPGELPAEDGFVLSPGLVGCCAAMSRSLYFKLLGFDQDMRFWGAEDADFGLKVWLSGGEVLCVTKVFVGHRFQARFDRYEVPHEHVLANQMRMAYKNFAVENWRAWLNRRRDEADRDVWEAAWRVFCERRGSVEVERMALSRSRVRDECWFARKFGLPWPPNE